MRMTRPLILIITLVFLFGLSPVARAAQTANIGVSYGEFTDTARNRTIPYKLYAPDPIPAPAPVVIFSHGLGGSIEGAPYLGAALASAGYMAFFIQHPGTDRTLWEHLGKPAEIKQALRQALRDKGSAADRFQDIPFVIDELTRRNAESGLLKGTMDLTKIGMAGHSYGARGVLMAAGEQLPDGGAKFKEPRIGAAVAFSPNIPESYIGMPEERLAPLYSEVTIPLFHITGTNDGHPFREAFDPATRTLPYKNITAPNQYLLVLNGADHGAFAGDDMSGGGQEYYYWQKSAAEGAVLFFNAYLKGDKKAIWALQGEFQHKLADGDRFEFK